MDTSAGFWLLAVLLLDSVLSFTQAQTVQKYFQAGGTLELSPQPISAPITSIVWKYDRYLLAEWVKGSIPLTYYSKFKGRTTLNTDTGVLEIRDLTAADTALYSVEINNQIQSQVFQTVEIEDVPQPEVEVKPLGCSSASEGCGSASQSCKLVCDGDVNKAGPVKYFKAGGTLGLSPQPISAPITSIVWKYDRYLLAEWVKDSIPLTYYSKFKGRTTLNTDTGVLEIRDLTAADTALYSVEINNQIQSQVFQTVEIEDVPQPEVEVKPLGCSSASEGCSSASPSCKLVCDGDVSKAGPVEYFWKKDDGEWEKSEINTMEIMNDEETQRVKTFTCRMKNLFSERDSKPLHNPLFQISPFPFVPSPMAVSNNKESEAPVTLGAVISSLMIVVVFCL